MLADTTNYPLLDIFWSMLEFFLFFLWIFLIITIFMDIVRSHDLGGAGKFAWVLLVIILPFIGAFIYLVVRGGGMHERAARRAQQQEQAFQDYVRQAAGSSGGDSTEELNKLSQLKSSGALTDAEFEAGKRKILGST